MIQLLPLKTKILLILLPTAAFVVISYAISAPQNNLEYLIPFFQAVSVLSIAVLFLGQSCIFPWICKTFRIFPDIHGSWKGDIFSNWNLISEKFGITDEEGHPFKNMPTPVHINISVRFLSISINLKSDSKYQNSKTLSSSIRTDEHGNYELFYVYESKVPNQNLSDEQFFYGAGKMTFSGKNPKEISGNFWTNRKWKEGLNTAGHFLIKRLNTKLEK